ncbi:MAG: response regulator [Bacteroidales bacterium]|nr:response regulator [Bacteroidales bacterium]
MKIFSKDFYLLSNDEDVSINNIRSKLLSWMLILSNILGLPIISVAMIEAFKLEQNYAAFIYLGFYLPVFFALILRKKTSYNFTVSLLLFSVYTLGLINIILYGFSGAGLPLFYCLAVLATVFLGLRAGLFTLFGCGFTMLIVAIFMIIGTIAIEVDLMEISREPISWATAILVMMFLGTIMIFGYGIIQHNLLHSLKIVKKQNLELQIASKKQLEQIYNLKKIKEELEIAKEKAEESNQLKTEFIQNMSHEIRTPMNAILGFSNILNKPNLNDEKRENYINIIQNSGNQLMRIIEDILEISELGTKQAKLYENEVCLNEFISEIFTTFKPKTKQKNISFSINNKISEKETVILTDKVKLNKILSTLIENAIKFTNEGKIELGYTILETHHDVSQHQDLQFYVKDTGIGVKPENQNIIFERFSQEQKEISEKVGGLGLGLAIAKENAEFLGGKITLESEKGKGSTFFVTIPFKPSISVSKKTNSYNNLYDNKKFTILIVEDEELNYLYLNTLLEDFDQNLVTLYAENGKDAIEICKKNNEIDVVLMDLKMPVMNGFEATKRIKKIRLDLPIIAQTAYSTVEEKELAMYYGCDDFITKPIEEEILFRMMNKYLVNK